MTSRLNLSCAQQLHISVAGSLWPCSKQFRKKNTQAKNKQIILVLGLRVWEVVSSFNVFTFHKLVKLASPSLSVYHRCNTSDLHSMWTGTVNRSEAHPCALRSAGLGHNWGSDLQQRRSQSQLGGHNSGSKYKCSFLTACGCTSAKTTSRR